MVIVERNLPRRPRIRWKSPLAAVDAGGNKFGMANAAITLTSGRQFTF